MRTRFPSPNRPRHLGRRRLARGGLIALAGAASLGLMSTGLPSAQARPASPDRLPAAQVSTAVKPHLSAEARKRGIEAGNAPMGWQHARLAPVTSTAATSLRASSTQVSTQATKLVPMSGVLGIDVASYQRTVNWASFKSQNRVFAYVKATEGTSYRNPYFTSQYTGAYKAGLIRGAYHFANPSGASGTAQADYFVRYGGGWRADGKTLPGVLDIEYNPYGGNTCYNKSTSSMVAWISDFVRQYKRRTGRDAVIYTTADWWKRCTGNTTKFRSTNPLWVARYGTKTPGTLPGRWPYYTFWQYSANPIDQNKFSASYSRLRVLARGR
jgi:GH25 family lysozyme M1 (1,4-beta-N-acetylmuramidase)